MTSGIYYRAATSRAWAPPTRLVYKDTTILFHIAGRQSIAIENTGNHVVIGNQDELPHSFDDVVRGRVSLPSAPFWQA